VPKADIVRRHPVTLSVGASTEAVIFRPSILAVLVLMTNSYRAGNSTSRSAGLAPFSILSTYKPDDLQAVITGITEDGLVVAIDNMLWNERKRIAELALSRGLPSMSWNSDMTDAGLLMSYGEDFKVQFRRIAVYDRIDRSAGTPVDSVLALSGGQGYDKGCHQN
jgi:hypothetical protein